jgi:hypothetical protein
MGFPHIRGPLVCAQARLLNTILTRSITPVKLCCSLRWSPRISRQHPLHLLLRPAPRLVVNSRTSKASFHSLTSETWGRATPQIEPLAAWRKVLMESSKAIGPFSMR